MCDAYTPAGEPIPTNKRSQAAEILSHPKVVGEAPWFSTFAIATGDSFLKKDVNERFSSYTCSGHFRQHNLSSSCLSFPSCTCKSFSWQMLHGTAGGMSPQVQDRNQQLVGSTPDIKTEMNPILNPRTACPGNFLPSALHDIYQPLDVHNFPISLHM